MASEGSNSVFEWSNIVSEGSYIAFGLSYIASEGSDDVFDIEPAEKLSYTVHELIVICKLPSRKAKVELVNG